MTNPISDVRNCDCMELMADFPDKYFDLAIVDPPYGIGFGMFNRTNKDSTGERIKANKYKNDSWDDNIPGPEYFVELKRVSKHQIIWGGNYYFDILGNTRSLICWYKKNPVKNFSDAEYAWNSIDTVARVFDFAYFGNIEGKTSASEKVHPTQKPIALYNWLIKNYAKPGDKILDTHLGSQSSRIAAYKLGFDFWGSELDQDYFREGCERFEKAIDEPLLREIQQMTQEKLF